MSNYEFLREYFSLLQKLLFVNIKNLGYATISHSYDDEQIYLNSTLTNSLLTEQELRQIEKEYRDLQRIPAIYFENCDMNTSLKDFLQNHNYKKSFEDIWMFYTKKDIDQKGFSIVKKVKTQQDSDIFLDTFNKCYQKDDPQNPYGEQTEYAKIVKKSWNNFHHNDAVESFIAYNENQPVAVATLNNYKELGYISNVGSLQKVRGKGFGKIATLYAVSESIKKGHAFTFLATEEGTHPNEFYKRIGFESTFTAVAFAREIDYSKTI